MNNTAHNSEPDHIAAHKHCVHNRKEVAESQQCGCFCCLAIFFPEKIFQWIDEDKNGVGQTARCPFCGIDSIIGSRAGYPMTREFLVQMEKYWFGDIEDYAAHEPYSGTRYIKNEQTGAWTIKENKENA